MYEQAPEGQPERREVAVGEEIEGVIGVNPQSEGGAEAQAASSKECIRLTVTIYGLIDPRTGEIRYVGKAIDPEKRLRGHMRERGVTHKAKWIQALKRLGLRPILRILEEIHDSNDLDWQQREVFWIASLRQNGCPLTNLDGGGRLGKCISNDTRDKISAANKGKRRSAEARAQMTLSRTGRKASIATRAKMSAVRVGLRLSAEARAKLSLSKMGHEVSAETRAKISSSRKGRFRVTGRIHTAETRAKMSAAKKGKKHTAEARANMSAARKGKRLSAEHIAKLIGREVSSATRAKLSEAGKGRKLSSETRYKIRIKALGRKRTPEQRAKISAKLLGKKRGPYGHNIRTLRKLGLVQPTTANPPPQ